MKKVLVCGGRHYNKTSVVFGVLDRLALNSQIMVINGGATGADQRVREWADERGTACATVPAPWGKHGASAGPIRNSWMLHLKPDIVLSFPGGRGTNDMTKKALSAGVETFAVTDTGEMIRMALDEAGQPICLF